MTDQPGGVGDNRSVNPAVPGNAGPTSGPRNMFGGAGTGDTSGFGGSSAGARHSRAPRGRSTQANEGVYAALERAFPQLGRRDRAGRRRPRRDDAARPAGVARRRRPDPARRPDVRFELLSSVSGVDYPTRPDRPAAARRTPAVDDPPPAHPTRGGGDGRRPARPEPCPVYPTADWHERETWDLFGLDLRRPPRPDADHDARRLGRPPAAQGLPARWHPVEYKGAQIPPPDERRSYA